MRGLAWIIIAMLMIPPGIPAQDATDAMEPDQADMFRQEELAQMLAPIALYPDSLIAQILMASTYPLEVVEAERWMRQNSGLKGDALDNALQEKTWDPSIKSLCHVPDVLFAMSDKLDQTRKLGDAYLAQQDDVMATIQDLRRRAEEQGNLKTTKEQTVTVEDQNIVIEPADPQVVYVPAYDPYYAYGPWWYPAYPPWYWYYPPGVVITGGFIAFWPPFFIGYNIFSWCWFDWHNRFIFVDFNKTRHFHRHGRHDSGKRHWQHNPTHRRGVAYRDRRTSERFGQRPGQRPRSGSEVRGYPSRDDRQRTIDRSGDRIDRRDRTPGTGTATERERSRDRIEQRDGSAPQRERTDRESVRGTARRETPFGRVGSGSFERRAGERGGESRRSSAPRYQGGNRGRQSGGPPSSSFQRGSQGGSQPGGIRRDSAPSSGRQSGGQGGGRQSGSPGSGKGGGLRR
jgi:hypothetical protein